MPILVGRHIYLLRGDKYKTDLFWGCNILFRLKGHCLKGESKCDFLHEIPEIMSDEASVTVVEKAPVVRSFTDEFPSLEESRGLKKKPQARLRAAQLLPDNSAEPSPSLAKLTDTYRAKTLEFSSRRKECFDLAKESFKRAGQFSSISPSLSLSLTAGHTDIFLAQKQMARGLKNGLRRATNGTADWPMRRERSRVR